MLRITIEAIGPDAREEAEHFCLCLGHQTQITDTFLDLLMQIANGSIYVCGTGMLEPGEPQLPPRIPGKCRQCETPLSLPGNFGLCQECITEIYEIQQAGMALGDYKPPPPPIIGTLPEEPTNAA